MNAYHLFVVFIGAGVGGSLRHVVGVLARRMFDGDFPLGTFSVNVTGSFVMGLLAGYFAVKGQASMEWRLFLTTGLLGGYTTFSAFSLESVLLWERGAAAMALIYVVGSVTLALGGFLLGLWIMRHV